MMKSIFDFGIARIALGAWLLFYATVGLIGLGIPAWVGFLLAGFAGLMILIGR